MENAFVIAAVMMAIIGNLPYLLDVIRGKTQPHPYTWLLWSIVSAVTFFGQLVKGGGMGSIPTGVAECFTIVIFLFSLRYGFKNIVKRDTYFLIVALLGLIPWALTNDPTISVVTVVSIDVLAFAPTIRKTWSHPSTETPLLYGMNVTRHVLTLFLLRQFNVATALHSIAMIATNSLMTAIIVGKKKTS